jgi:hypothetical protein
MDGMALGSVLGSATHALPAVAATLGVVWYALVIYDRLKYGPDLDGRTLHSKTTTTTETVVKPPPDA